MIARALSLLATIGAMAILVVAAGCSQSAAPPAKTQPTAEQPKATGEQAKPTPAAKPTEPAKAASPAAKGNEPATSKELATVRVALQGQSSDAAFFIADARGYFKEQGIDFQFIPFSAPTEMVPAIATNQVDVAGSLASAAFFNALERGAKMKGVADKGRLSKGNGFIALVVRKDLVDSGKYKSPADLKGMKVALSPPPMTSPNAYGLDSVLQKGGLTIKDVELIGLALADMPAGLAGGSIDAGVTTEPFVSKAVEMGAGVRVVGFDEVNPNHQLTGVSYSEAFLRDRPDVGKRFMVAYVKGLRDYNDAFVRNKNKADIIKILTQSTSIKDASTWESAVPPGLNPDGYLNVESLMNQVEWLAKYDQIKVKPKPEDFIDNSYVDYAISVLGKYQ